MPQRVRESGAPAVHDARAAAAWNHGAREGGSPGRELRLPLRPARIKTRAQLHLRLPPLPPLLPRLFFRSAKCSAVFSTNAILPRREREKIQTQSSRCSAWRKSVVTIFTCQRRIPQARKMRKTSTIIPCFRSVLSALTPPSFPPRRMVMPHSNHYFDYGGTLSGRTCTAMFATDRKHTRTVVNHDVTQPRQDVAPVEKLVHLALPVRLTHMQNGERGRNKSMCQVVWTADPNSPLRGQFTVECVEGNRIPWEEELRLMQEQYLPIIPDGPKKRPVMNTFRRGDQNRRRSPRFQVEGEADLLRIAGPSGAGSSSVEGRVEQISEYGCLVSASDLLVPGTGLRLALNIYDVSVALKGNVKYTAENRAMGVEFQEIRQGDRPLLDYVLKQVKKIR